MTTLEDWHKTRMADVAGPQGDVSLIAMYEVDKLSTVKEIGGQWQPANMSKPGLTVTAAADDGLYINGVLIEGTVELIADETVVSGRNGLTAMATSQPGSMHLLAIWDEHCEALQQFDRIDYYPYNEEANITGKLVQDETMFAFSHTGDQALHAREHESIGVVQMMYAGQEYKLRPFKSGAYSIIVFRDETSGEETYGMGRMLVIQPESDGSVVLDFNKAFLPPCAFSPYFNCPMPPLSNRINAKITAGEKQVLTKQ